MADSTDVDYEEFARLCLDRVRLAALGRSVEGTLTSDDLMAGVGVDRRTALEAIAALRLAGMTDEDDRVLIGALRDVADSLPKPERAAPAITQGEWTPSEVKVLEAYFSGERLVEIPSQHRKRLVILERLAQDFDPGIRYDETEVSRRLAHYHADYAALRRYLVDEGLLTRVSGVYWRTGGRFPDEAATDVRPADAGGRGPVLATEDRAINLIPYGPDHHAELLIVANDERITRFMTDQFPYPYTEADADSWIAKCEAQDPPLSFAITVDGRLAGGVGCEQKGDIRTGTAEVGWWLSPQWWGRGIAAVAVRRYLGYCFDDLDLHRVEAGVFVSNPASARVAEKAGLVLEGISRDAYLKNGELIDRLSYGLARSQWHRPVDVS